MYWCWLQVVSSQITLLPPFHGTSITFIWHLCSFPPPGSCDWSNISILTLLSCDWSILTWPFPWWDTPEQTLNKRFWSWTRSSFCLLKTTFHFLFKYFISTFIFDKEDSNTNYSTKDCLYLIDYFFPSCRYLDMCCTMLQEVMTLQRLQNNEILTQPMS